MESRDMGCNLATSTSPMCRGANDTGHAFAVRLRAMLSAESKPEQTKCMKEALNMKHSPLEWQAVFDASVPEAKSPRRPLGRLRRLIQHQTMKAMHEGKYVLPDGTVRRLDAEQMESAPKRTHYHRRAPSYDRHCQAGPTKLSIVEGDCLLAAELVLRETGRVPAVLNMANANTPGGGYANGAGAQEENLHRRTNLVHCLEDPGKKQTRTWSYPLPPAGGLYSQGVVVFRGAESDGYPFLQEPYLVDMITVAAVSRPRLLSVNSMAPEAEEATQAKVVAMLAMCAHHGAKDVILSAFGCGAFKNPPTHVARIFRRVIEVKFKDVFSSITFAIIEDHNSGGRNVEAFAKAFEVEAVPLSKFSLRCSSPAGQETPPAHTVPAKPPPSSSSSSSSSSASASSTGCEGYLESLLPPDDPNRSQRLAIRKRFYTILLKDGPEYESADAACKIEAALLEEYKDMKSKEYREQLKMLLSNLSSAGNGQLREALLRQQIRPSTFAKMSSEEVCNPQLRREDLTKKRELLEDLSAAATNENVTTQFQCSKCRKSKCSFTEMQTRSGDEPMTVYLTCLHCGKRWRQ